MKVLTLLLAGMLVFVVGCGGDDDDGDVTNIEDADSCEQVADFALNEVQLLLDDLSDMTLQDMGSEEPESFTRFEEEMTKAEEKSGELDCSDEEMADHFEDGIDDLEADGPVAELILQGMQSEGDLFDGATP